MLPVTQKDFGGGRKGGQGRISRLVGSLVGWFKKIMKDKNSRNLLMFLCLNFSFAFVELFYGVWTNSLGLISDSFHMFFDCTGLLAGLAASLIIQWKANEHYSYGYERAEVLAGVFAIFLLSRTSELFFNRCRIRQRTLPAVHLLLHILGSG